ncbi:XRE family transcriptional regulator [Pseudoxanthomonas winnipegensis]|uniref:XRE family transcriptional regulator n=1 Tax=Pseudoxanthomonas winnipegensis TaxID=2480810 RepID=A0A4Q8LYN3_9GAMM|nr:helix-turn-helix transcriptional regulator [Pseudoxanthomonas winnipegensis]TAA37566.1 XRE family transcriptional regulator [Pseudoxanthomonas winnipegensis]
MRSVDDLLESAKAATGARNDTELAAKLGIKPAAVSNYRRGVSLPNAVVCATLAGLTGEPLARVLGVVGEARAISSEEKAVWRRLAATATLLAVALLGSAQQPAKAATAAFSPAPPIHYAKLDLAGSQAGGPVLPGSPPSCRLTLEAALHVPAMLQVFDQGQANE